MALLFFFSGSLTGIAVSRFNVVEELPEAFIEVVSTLPGGWTFLESPLALSLSFEGTASTTSTHGQPGMHWSRGARPGGCKASAGGSPYLSLWAEPSRPHLLWVCEAFRHLAPPGVPTNRVEERLLAKVVPEMPSPPVVLAVDEFLDSLAEEVHHLPAAPEGFLLATDGSCVTEVSAVAFALLGGGTCGLGVPGEDQTPYKAEVQALLWLLEALLRAGRPGCYFVLVDCTAALDAARGKGHLRKLCDRFTALWTLLATAGIKVTLHWIPSHGKRAPHGWRPPGSFSEAQARLLNQAADAEARRLAARRARGSARQLCCQARTAAEAWETGAINALHRISSAFELEYQA